jgi:hypothetical protein
MYYILTTFLEPCSSIYVNIKGGGTIPTLLNQLVWKLLYLASDVIPLYTWCPIPVMCRRNQIWHCQHGGKCFQSVLSKSHLNSVSSAVIFYILLKQCCVPLSQNFKTERRHLSCDKNGKKNYTALQNSDSLLQWKMCKF